MQLARTQDLERSLPTRSTMVGIRGSVLIIEDQEGTGDDLAVLVANEGFNAIQVATAADAISAVTAKSAVAVLICSAIPSGIGADICRALRQQDSALTIMIVTCRSDETSIIRAFDAGADDYVVEPFCDSELAVRLESHLRRVATLKHPESTAPANGSASRDCVSFGDITVDLAARAVEVSDEPVALSALEFQLLEFMARNPGRAFSREQLLAGVYGYSADISTDRIDVLVRRVRKRLGDGPNRGDQLVTVPGYGYRLERPVRQPA
jgi:two-component system response regulator MtrA